MRYRERKSTDQEQCEKAFQLLLALIEENQDHIEPTLWVGVMIGALAENYDRSEIPFHEFKLEMLEAIEHYKY